jgi:predicted MPP superfamily phosphohydrolase
MPSLQGIEPLVRRDVPNILLSHNPNTFYRAAELGIELSLAGHTHGGQVNIEIVHSSWNPAQFMTRFVAGMYQLPMGRGQKGATRQSAVLYVNRGLGTLALPARIGATPEITLLTLRSDMGAVRTGA